MQSQNLKKLNTLGLSSESPLFFEIQSENDLLSFIEEVKMNQWQAPFYFLGGGSNLILSEKISRPVLKISLTGKKIISESADSVVIQVGAGENWNDFVQWTVAHGFYGLENLVLIPGTVGASPIQNIGAYGVEVKEHIKTVKGYDFLNHTWKTIFKESCEFSYRDSVFKRPAMVNFLITELMFELHKDPKRVQLQYKELHSKLISQGDSLTPENILNAVIELRNSKLPDPKNLGNAGSFFKNPIVTSEKSKSLQMLFPGLPMYPQPDGSVKISAGWMIESCGWKGQSLGPVGMYEKQALVLVNHGSAVATDVLNLSNIVISDVQKKFSVQLEIEPLVWK